MGEDPVPEEEVEVERSPVPDLSPPSPPPPPSGPAPADTVDPSYTAQQSPEHIHISYRELAAVMDAVCALATTHALGLGVFSIMFCTAVCTAVEACLYFGWEEKLGLGVFSIMFCTVFGFINCLLILYRIHVLADSRQ